MKRAAHPLPGLGDHRIHNVAALPGAAYCEMTLAAARMVLGEGSEVRDIRVGEMLLLDDKTPVFALASVTSPWVVDFVVETFQEGERVRRAVAVLHAGDGQDQPPARVHGKSRLYIFPDKPAAAASCRRLIKQCLGLAYRKILTAHAAALYDAP